VGRSAPLTEALSFSERPRFWRRYLPAAEGSKKLPRPSMRGWPQLIGCKAEKGRAQGGDHGHLVGLSMTALRQHGGTLRRGKEGRAAAPPRGYRLRRAAASAPAEPGERAVWRYPPRARGGTRRRRRPASHRSTSARSEGTYAPRRAPSPGSPRPPAALHLHLRTTLPLRRDSSAPQRRAAASSYPVAQIGEIIFLNTWVAASSTASGSGNSPGEILRLSQGAASASFLKLLTFPKVAGVARRKR
jgi:hypothetical protein